jgi:hypothetical protein
VSGGIFRKVGLVLVFAGLALAGRATAAPAKPALFGLFVGIDNYAYQWPDHPDAELKQLKGAKADAQKVEQLLVERFDLTPANAVTLYDSQATRAAIGAALNRQIEAARRSPGSTLVFYYSGHGSHVRDQARRHADNAIHTIVPYDARTPGRIGDISGVTIKKVLDRAQAWGVNVVTIYDSCESANATRAVGLRQDRVAAPHDDLTSTQLDSVESDLPTPPAPPPGTKQGYYVHLAAAQPDEAAAERPLHEDPHGPWGGDFTEALLGALRQADGPSYRELIDQVRVKLERLNPGQHPHAEGDLDGAFLGASAHPLRLLRAEKTSSGVYTVEGGTLSGVTKGSTFDVFRDFSEARRDQRLGSGTVVESTPSDARFRPDGAAGLPDHVWIRETRHDYGDRRLRVAVVAPSQADRARLQSMVQPLSFVEVVTTAPQLVLVADAAGVRLQTSNGTPVAEDVLPSPKSKDGCAGAGEVASRVQCVLEKAARFQALLALAESTGPASPGGLGQSFKLEPKCADDLSSCDPAAFQSAAGEPLLPSGVYYKLKLTNHSGKANLYVFRLSDSFSVLKLYPPRGESADGNAAAGAATGGAFNIDGGCKYNTVDPGEDPAKARAVTTYFLVLGTVRPIRGDLLEQAGVGGQRSAESGAIDDPLSQLLSQANRGVRGDVTADPGSWDAAVFPLTTPPGGPCRS